MIDNKLIAQFIPAQVLEAPLNTYIKATREEKIRLAFRRFLTHNNFTDGDITNKSPRLLIKKYYFNPERMGYDVIARIL